MPREIYISFLVSIIKNIIFANNVQVVDSHVRWNPHYAVSNEKMCIACVS